MPESTVRAIDLRYLELWATSRRRPALRQMGVDEIHQGKKQKFLTVLAERSFARQLLDSFDLRPAPRAPDPVYSYSSITIVVRN
jgi:hypothetical protein